MDGSIMRYCAQCGNELDDRYSFCPYCGTPVEEMKSSKDRRRDSYAGSIVRCPSCGAVVGSFMAFCPTCGYEIRNAASNSRGRQFEQELKQAASVEQRCDMIRDFYIPNTKEDIYEFFIMATSNIKAGGPDTDAWLAKLEQAYQKAELVFGKSPELDRITETYEKYSHMGEVARRASGRRPSIDISVGIATIIAGIALTVIFGVLAATANANDLASLIYSDLAIFGAIIALLGLAVVVPKKSDNSGDSEKDEK